MKSYTAKERRYFVDALTAAKKRLDTGTKCPSNQPKSIYICAALGFDSKTAQDVIMYRLRISAGASGSVVGFLRHSGIANKLMTHRNLQEFRHRWVDALIEEFSK